MNECHVCFRDERGDNIYKVHSISSQYRPSQHRRIIVTVSVSTATATIMSGTGNNTVTGAATLTALEELMEYFECPVCLSVPRQPPIWQCDQV